MMEESGFSAQSATRPAESLRFVRSRRIMVAFFLALAVQRRASEDGDAVWEMCVNAWRRH